MKRKIVLISLLISICGVLSCSSVNKTQVNKSIKEKGKLDDQTYIALVDFLEKTKGKKLNDTIIIKYDYNNSSCWDLLDSQSSDYIFKVIENSQKKIKIEESQRTNLSVFRFAEPGDNFNKIIALDKTIIKDRNRELFNMLFSKTSSCGNSILIMPDQQYIFKKSDSHLEILKFTKSKINNLIKNKNGS